VDEIVNVSVSPLVLLERLDAIANDVGVLS